MLQKRTARSSLSPAIEASLELIGLISRSRQKKLALKTRRYRYQAGFEMCSRVEFRTLQYKSISTLMLFHERRIENDISD